MRAMSLKLPEALAWRLAELAAERGITKSELLREALKAFGRSERNTVTGAARELVGCIHGPKDLSTAKKHLEGYGS